MGIGLLGFDLEAGLKSTSESTEQSRALGFTWGEGFASTIDGILKGAFTRVAPQAAAR